jgi:hypothetical protein
LFGQPMAPCQFVHLFDTSVVRHTDGLLLR